VPNNRVNHSTIASIENNPRDPAGISFVPEIVGDNVRLGIDVCTPTSEGTSVSVGILLLCSSGIVVGSTGIGTVGDVEVPGGILSDGVIEGEKVSSDSTLGTDGMLMSST
jgi:hypothetical protein